ncbi:unnamed protein product [Rangifer tarandus platyrhynchus]|uniref:Uncharacterized protein n=1 Tax=Rangifer tarandus platyrhynchus TaxID=3082113 RepID=A0ABN9A2X2_RANTA|nr:unnamed protein product [Rangifer tarandus platyrhynchus]
MLKEAGQETEKGGALEAALWLKLGDAAQDTPSETSAGARVRRCCAGHCSLECERQRSSCGDPTKQPHRSLSLEEPELTPLITVKLSFASEPNSAASYWLEQH